MSARRLLAHVLFFLALTGGPQVASAHPLGNFTINHLARVGVQKGAMHVRYVLDIAEIPTFQIMHAADEPASWSPHTLDAWSRNESQLVLRGLRITVDGNPVSLAVTRANARLRPGAGGLPTLYWTGAFTATLPRGAHRISVSDTVYGDRRIGWRDIVLGDEGEPTADLTHYPSALIGSPRRISRVSFTVASNGTPQAVRKDESDAGDASAAPSVARSGMLSDMFANPDRAPLFVLLTMLVAFGLGALHAIEPGHGKALLAFTLVGTRATIKQAVILAASLTFAHTAAVFALGIVLFFAAGFATESLYAWITLLSGAAVAVIGARNLARYLHGARPHMHAHDHDPAHDHHHGDGAHSHSHTIPGTSPIDFRAAVVAAMSGGVAPCPAAIVVMLAALRLHQLGYGLLLIVVFSMGLATVLAGIGIAVVHGAAWVSQSRRFDRLVKAGPLLSAVLIALVGSVMLAQGFAAQGVSAPVWLMGLLVALAIAGYALSAQHVHTHAAVAGDA